MRQHCIYPSYWQDHLGSFYETALYLSKLLAGSSRFTLWDSIASIQATGRISQVHSMRQHCIYPSYWQDQPGSLYETALYLSKLLAGSARFTLWDSILFIQATGRISQVHFMRQHCMYPSYWQDQPGSLYETALYLSKLLAGSARLTLWDSILWI